MESSDVVMRPTAGKVRDHGGGLDGGSCDGQNHEPGRRAFPGGRPNPPPLDPVGSALCPFRVALPRTLGLAWLGERFNSQAKHEEHDANKELEHVRWCSAQDTPRLVKERHCPNGE